MHGSSLCRMRWFVLTYLSDAPQGQKVLDIGSCDVAGGTYRQFFDPAIFEYVGLDMAPGPNVDIVPSRPYCWREIASNSFDIVISGQAFEHAEFFWLTAAEMARVLRPGGLLCLIAPRGFARHRFPVDCYRFDADGMVAIARWCGLRPLHASTDMAPPDAGGSWHIEDCEDSMLVARKPEDWSGVARPDEYVFAEADMESLHRGFVPCARLRIPPVLVADYEIARETAARTADELEKARLEHSRELAAVNAELEDLRRRLRGFENSNSWRLTRPLRAARRAAASLLRAGRGLARH